MVYVIGFDWGIGGGFTETAVINASSNEILLFEVVQDGIWQNHVERLKDICARFNPCQIWINTGSGGNILIEQLLKEKLPIHPFSASARTLDEITTGLRDAIESGKIKLVGEVGVVECTAIAVAWYGAKKTDGE